ncbi:MAG: hypothetical protein L7S02_05095 [Flavobacteriales bacterium]|nr:hypothetical protein [Flavobacteriales bacterium]
MSRKSKGRKKSGRKNNRDYEYDPVTKTHKLKPHIARRRSAANTRAKAAQQAEARELQRRLERADAQSPYQHAARRSIPIINSNELGPCCSTVEALNNKNEAMLCELLGTKDRAIDSVTLRPEILVIKRWFVRKHQRHMAHFRAFLRERKVRTTG